MERALFCPFEFIFTLIKTTMMMIMTIDARDDILLVVLITINEIMKRARKMEMIS